MALGPLSCIFPGVPQKSWTGGVLTHICSQLVLVMLPLHLSLTPSPITVAMETAVKQKAFKARRTGTIFFCPILVTDALQTLICITN